MSRPTVCFTCNRDLSPLYKKYDKLLEEKLKKIPDATVNNTTLTYTNDEIFEALGLTKQMFHCRLTLSMSRDLTDDIIPPK